MYDRLLIAVDGSEEATHAARRGLELARQFDARVDVVHVVDRSALRLTRSATEKTRLQDRGRDALAEIEQRAAGHDQSVTTTLTEGNPAVEITAYADEGDADLIVVGRQGMTGLGKRLLGGVTEQVLSRSDCPVFVVPSDGAVETDADYDRLLLPTDGSENAEQAVSHGVAVAAQYGSAVHVLNVVDLQAAGGLFTAGGLESEFLDRLETTGQQVVDAVVAEINATDPGLDLSTAVERTTSFDGAAAGIRAYIDRNEIDLVVMGSQGRSNLKRQLLGSVASTVLRTVDVPALVVPRTT